MRIIQAVCAIEYIGRCHTYLDYATRLVMIKSDGSVLVMNDKGIKPLNYMMNVKSANRAVGVNGDELLIIEGRKETLVISMRDILSDNYLPFGDDDDDMKKTGTEDELQAYMAMHIGDYISGAKFLCREFETGKGKVDVCGLSDTGSIILVEMKRKAMKKDVYQVLRYADGIALMRGNLAEDNIRSIEVKGSRKRDVIGTMISTSALDDPMLVLAAGQFAKNVPDEAMEHNVTLIDVSEAKKMIEDEKVGGSGVLLPSN